jgi:hypothetical protein
LSREQGELLDLLMNGFNTTQATAQLGISKQAVSYRLQGLRALGVVTTEPPDDWTFKRGVGFVSPDGGVEIVVVPVPRLDRDDVKPNRRVAWVKAGYEEVLVVVPSEGWRFRFSQLAQAVLEQGATELAEDSELMACVTRAIGALAGLEAVLPAWTAKTEKEVSRG